jgi:hypothetical protein
MADERKERVLHTRIPDSLEREIKHRARRLGMSVSTVVRHVLQHTFGLVDDIVADSTNVALTLAGGDPPPRAPATVDDGEPAIVAWQEAVLNVNAVCERCNAILARGTRAAVAVRERPGPRAMLCLTCLPALGDAGEEER